MQFEFTTAGRIVFGGGAVAQAGTIAADLGRRALVVTGATSSRARLLLELLGEHKVATTTFAVIGEPTIRTIEEGVRVGRTARCDHVIAFGGGSAVDAGKAIAVMLTNQDDEHPLLEFLEVIGRSRPLAHPPLPLVAIPTTAGTGSEMTRNSVITSPEHRVKVSLRSPLMLARIALIDPELTYDLPPALTATTGIDALTQLVEPFVCKRANPLTDAICVEGLPRIARSLRRAVREGRDPTAREDMAVASLFGGMALANAGLGAVHGLAGPMGGMFPAPHGALCAALLPSVVAMNLRALREREPASAAVARYARVSQLLTGDAGATAEDGVTWLHALAGDVGIKPLSSYGVQLGHIPDIVAAAQRASSMRANPIVLTSGELGEIVAADAGVSAGTRQGRRRGPPWSRIPRPLRPSRRRASPRW
jgi:alcohol dehydrogenase class IV